MTDNKKALCVHCKEELLCPTCETPLLPAIYGDSVLGFLCPKCMQAYSTAAAAEDAPLPVPTDTHYPMDN